MKERMKIIKIGLGIIIFAVVGLWEYMQLYLYFDIPQIVVIMPIVGMLAALLLRRWCFVVPLATAAVSIVYQLVETKTNAAELFASSKWSIIINLLPIIVAFMLLGTAGGFLIRVLINRNKSRMVGIISCFLGILITFGSSVILVRNPLYPFMARHAIHEYAQKYDSDGYQVSKVIVYYSFADLEYQGSVVMSDGVVYAVYHQQSTGKVYDLTDLS